MGRNASPIKIVTPINCSHCQADELLTHKQNGDGAYLVSYSSNKSCFFFSCPIYPIDQCIWADMPIKIVTSPFADTPDFPFKLFDTLNLVRFPQSL